MKNLFGKIEGHSMTPEEGEYYNSIMLLEPMAARNLDLQ